MLFLVGVFFVSLIIWTLWNIRVKRIPGIPGPQGIPILGNTLQIIARAESILDFFVEVSTQFSPPRSNSPCQVGLLGMPPMVLLNDEVSFEHILKTTSQHFVKGPISKEIFQELLGDGIFNADGMLWKHQRKTASNLFTMRNLKGHMSEIFHRNIEVLISALEPYSESGQSVDMQDMFFRFTFDSFVEIAFGVRLESLLSKDPHPFQVAFDRAQGIAFERYVSPQIVWKLKRFLNIGSEKEYVNCIKAINSFVYTILGEHDESRNSNQKNLISLFLNKSVFHDNEPISEKYLRDIALNFIIAGRDTTAQTLSWLFWSLSQNPDIEKSIVSELNCTNGRVFASDDCSTLEMLDHSIKETLRLFPPVPADNKMCLKDTTLPSGFRIPRGSMVFYSMYNLARRMDVWGPDAKDFNPKRWENEENPSPFKFCSFNAGPRMCLGKSMALTEAKMVSASLLSFFRFELVPGQTVTYGPSITLPMRDPLMMKVHRRFKTPPQFQNGSSH